MDVEMKVARQYRLLFRRLIKAFVIVKVCTREFIDCQVG